jgi:hypothetical protein
VSEVGGRVANFKFKFCIPDSSTDDEDAGTGSKELVELKEETNIEAEGETLADNGGADDIRAAKETQRVKQVEAEVVPEQFEQVVTVVGEDAESMGKEQGHEPEQSIEDKIEHLKHKDV